MVKAQGREAWAQGGKGKVSASRAGFVPKNSKGLGPNKASGHKGGMGRQGSKQG